MWWLQKEQPSRDEETELSYNEFVGPPQTNYIICNGVEETIVWDKVYNFKRKDPYTLSLPETHYKKVNKPRKVTMFINHWDACLSSRHCFNILLKRKLSVHFAIDNDGSIYQFMDTNHIGFHAGSRKWNNLSIGVEISNAYYCKYQDWYIKNGYGKRPIWRNDVVHSSDYGKEFLGFYDIQLRALEALTEVIHRIYGVPLITPNTKTVYKKAADGKYSGFINHYHLTKRKMDCAGLNLYPILESANNMRKTLYD